MRASHADRDQVIGVLQTAFVQGRLAKDEFDQRVGQTLAARTWAELAALTADLPAGLTAAEPRRPAAAPGGRAVLRPGRVITAATALYAGAWAVFLLPSQIGENPLVRPLILDATSVYLGVLIICVASIIASRRDRRSSGQPPRRPSADGPAFRHLPPDAWNAFRRSDWMGCTDLGIRRPSPSL